MTNLNTFNQNATIYYNINAFAKPHLKTLSQFTLSDFSTLAEYVITDCHTVTLANLPSEKSTLLDLFNLIDCPIDAVNKIRTGYSAVLQHLPRLTIIEYIKLLSDTASSERVTSASASASASTINIDTQLSKNEQNSLDILSNLIDKLTAETASRSLRIKQFEAERRKQHQARAERRASLAERELIERRKQRVKQVQAQKSNLKMFIKALSVTTDEASFSQKVLKMADLIDSDLDL